MREVLIAIAVLALGAFYGLWPKRTMKVLKRGVGGIACISIGVLFLNAMTQGAGPAAALGGGVMIGAGLCSIFMKDFPLWG